MRRVEVGGMQGRGNPLTGRQQPPDRLSYLVADHVLAATPGLQIGEGPQASTLRAMRALLARRRARIQSLMGQRFAGVKW